MNCLVFKMLYKKKSLTFPSSSSLKALVGILKLLISSHQLGRQLTIIFHDQLTCRLFSQILNRLLVKSLKTILKNCEGRSSQFPRAQSKIINELLLFNQQFKNNSRFTPKNHNQLILAALPSTV